MKRLLVAGLVAGAALAGTGSANATILACDNAPVLVNCYSFRYGKWCSVWVQATHSCIDAKSLIGPAGS